MSQRISQQSRRNLLPVQNSVSEEFLAQLSLIHDEVVINLQRTKVHVFSDSVLCLGKVLQHPECNKAWKNRIAGVRSEKSYKDCDVVSRETTEFEWNIFPGFTTLQLCDKIGDLLSSAGQTPESFTGRILFLCQCSMTFSVTSTTTKMKVQGMLTL